MQRRDFVRRTAEAGIAFGILRQVTACQGSAPPTRNPDFITLRDSYFARSLALNPVTSTYLGGDGYDSSLAAVNGRLRNYGADAIKDEIAFYRGVVRDLERFDPAVLDPIDGIDHSVIEEQIRFMLHQLDELRYQERCVDTYVTEPFRGVDWQIQQMQDPGDGTLGTEDEWALVATRVEAIPAYLQTARANLLAGKRTGNRPDWRMVERDGVASSRANAEYFTRTLEESARRYMGDRPFAASLRQRLAAGGAAAGAAYRAFADFLTAAFGGDLQDRFALGTTNYEWRVQNCLREARSADDLYQYGEYQVQQYEEFMFSVASEVAKGLALALPFGTPAEKRAGVRAVMNRLGADSPKDDEQLFQWFRDTADRLVAYGRERDLFDIPATYRLDIVPTPPVLRSTIDAAYYPAPPFKHAGVGRFYLTPTENDPALLKLNNRASIADLTAHEGFPGHDWHFKYMSQHAAEISNVRWLTPGAVEDSFSMWEDSMATEGWALYAEELVSDPTPDSLHGVYTPAEFLYELQGQLLRAVRVRVDVGLHTGRMSFDDAVDYYTEHVEFYPGACAAAGRDPTARAICENARRAIYRYSKWPTQAITYNLGKNAIIELREAYRVKLGPRYSEKEFHQRFMRMGTIPTGYFRQMFFPE
jgi:uncharacterized protein (DUF885 family)